MTLIVLAVLLLLAAILCRAGRRRLAGGVGGLTLLLFLAVACGPVPLWLLDHLDSYASIPAAGWAPRNAIVLLGAGTVRATPDAPLAPELFAYGRIVQAAMLYRDCAASGQQCRLLVSGGDSQHHGAAEALVYAGVLRRLGVPADGLLLESRSMNTWQNAQFSRPLLQAYAPQKLLLVTSGIHLRRSLLDFAHFGMRPTPMRGDDLEAPLSALPLSWNIALCDLALHEYMGIARYHVYNAMGWNAPAIRSPQIPASG